jgi:hypothetical protein
MDGGTTWVESAAEFALLHWVDRVGGPGTAAMGGCPGLLAAVDQHAAAVRDAVADPTGQLGAEKLAAYADGVNDAAARHGWTLPGGINWAQPSWPVVRLLAVCVLAQHAR